MERSWNVEFDHVGFVTHDKARVRDFLLDLLGGELKWVHWSGDDEAFWGTRIWLGDTNVEIIEPGRPDSYLQPFLAKRGPGLHHICWYVDEPDAIIEGLHAGGYETTGVQRRESGEAYNIYTRPSRTMGVLYQFRKRTPGQLSVWQPKPTTPPRAVLHHVTNAVPDPVPARTFYELIFGADPGQLHPNPDFVGQEMRIDHPDIGIIWPTADGFVSRYLARTGPGLHHVAFRVYDMDAVLSAAERLGCRLVNPRGNPVEDVFIHQDNPTGALLRLSTPH